MARRLYKSYLKVLEKWPIDQAKLGRDLGERIHELVRINFNAGELTKISEIDVCTRNCKSLNRLASNYHSLKFPRLHKSTATGLTADISNKLMSNETLKFINK